MKSCEGIQSLASQILWLSSWPFKSPKGTLEESYPGLSFPRQACEILGRNTKPSLPLQILWLSFRPFGYSQGFLKELYPCLSFTRHACEAQALMRPSPAQHFRSTPGALPECSLIQESRRGPSKYRALKPTCRVPPQAPPRLSWA